MQYETLTGSGKIFRIGVRSNAFVTDKAVTALGFSGIENTDWVNVNSVETEVIPVPSGLTLTLIPTGVQIVWTDNSSGVTSFEVWGSDDNVTFTKLSDIEAGTVTYNDVVTPTGHRYYKVKGKKGNAYSDFTEVESIPLLYKEIATTPTYIDAGCVNNGDGSYTFSASAYLQWNKLITGKTYKVSFEIDEGMTGAVMGYIVTAWDWNLTEPGVYSYTLTAGDAMFAILGSNFVGTIRNITCRQVLTNADIFDNGKVVLTLDDGGASQFVAYEDLVAQGETATFYLITSIIDAVANLTWAQCQAMNAGGMDMQCHSNTHANLTTLNQAQVLAEYQAVNDAFAAHSLPAPRHTSYPAGLTSADVKTWTATMRDTARVVNEGIVNKNSEKMALKTYGMDISTDYEALKVLITTAKFWRDAVILYGHGIDGAQIPRAKFNEVIDYAQSIGMDIVTVAELYDLMTGYVAYWATLISATVENAEPTKVVLTFPSAKALVATDFTIAGKIISDATWVGAVLTLTVSEAFVYNDTPVVTFVKTSGTVNVTNNVGLLLYNPLSWGEWTTLSGIGMPSGMELTVVAGYSKAEMPLTLKPSTSYGILHKIVSNNTTVRFGISTGLFVAPSVTIADVGQALGYVKSIKSTPASVTVNVIRVTQLSGGSDGSKIKFSEIRVFELPVGSTIATDFATLTADQLNAKYPYKGLAETLNLANYELTWSDEFTGVALDTTKWVYETGTRRQSLNAVDAVSVDDGHVTVKTFPSGADIHTGFITTQGKFSQLHGYFEARLRHNKTNGNWGAFWLMPVEQNALNSGGTEIDVAEFFNVITSHVVNHALHWDGYGVEMQSNGIQLWMEEEAHPSDTYHTYGVEWTDSYYKWFVDGKLVYQAAVGISVETSYLLLTMEVDVAQKAIINAVGAGFYDDMLVDYVRAYRRIS